MKLLFLTNSFPYGVGEEFIETEILYLANIFDEVFIVPFTCKKGIVRKLPPNVTVLECLYDEKHGNAYKFFYLIFSRYFYLHLIEYFCNKKNYSLKLFLRFLGITFKSIKSFYSFKFIYHSLSKRVKVDLVYSFWGLGGGAILPFLDRVEKNLPSITRLHRYDLYDDVSLIGYFPMRKKLLESITLCAPISKHGKEFLQQKYQKVNCNLKEFYLGTKDFGVSNPSKDGIFRILSCSSLIPVKRVETIAESLLKLDFPFIWNHFGTGELLGKLESIILTIKDKVILHGHCSNENVMNFLLNTSNDLFINVSSSEGIPVSIMEAQSFGIPIIATDVGGVSEIVNNSNGRLLNKSITAHDLALEIEWFYENWEKNKMFLRDESRESWLLNFQAEKNYTKFCDEIKKILGN
ncbi:MAG: glycosyltransferase [Lentisphaeraceae bacterium]|nr:glycosyltransferase [Lentisphaeraceae bacterium]